MSTVTPPRVAPPRLGEARERAPKGLGSPHPPLAVLRAQNRGEGAARTFTICILVAVLLRIGAGVGPFDALRTLLGGEWLGGVHPETGVTPVAETWSERVVLRTRRVLLPGGGSSPFPERAPLPPAVAAAAAAAPATVGAPAPVPAPAPAPLPPAPPAPRAAAHSLSAPAIPEPAPLLPVSSLLPVFHPLAPYPPTRDFSVLLATGWFTGCMPYFNGRAVCPVSRCTVTLGCHSRHDVAIADADVVLYHMARADYPHDGGEGVTPPAREGKQLVALMAAEGFDLPSRPDSLYASFNSEHSTRPGSFVRDSYVLWFLNDAVKQGLGPQAPLRLDARVWGDIWEAPLATRDDATSLASWSSSYCSGAHSNREGLVRGLLDAGLTITILGDVGNCLRNAPASLLGASREAQSRKLREFRFHLAFENHRMEGYVTEKVRVCALCPVCVK